MSRWKTVAKAVPVVAVLVFSWVLITTDVMDCEGPPSPQCDPGLSRSVHRTTGIVIFVVVMTFVIGTSYDRRVAEWERHRAAEREAEWHERRAQKPDCAICGKAWFECPEYAQPPCPYCGKHRIEHTEAQATLCARGTTGEVPPA